MSLLQLIFAEIRYRHVNFVLCLLAMALAGALFVAGPTLVAGYSADTATQLAAMQEKSAERLENLQREAADELAELDKKTVRLMRDLGVNLRIVHKDTNFGDLYTDFAALDFPEDYVHKIAEAESIETVVHLVATLQHKMKWNDRTILLVGMKPVQTNSQKAADQKHMVKGVQPGTVLVGHELGVGKKAGDTLEIDGHTFTIAEVRPEMGNQEDVQLALDLADAQRVLNKPGRINQIMALNCKCKGNRISVIRQELEGVLPDTKVTEHLSMAEAREKQRDLVEEKRKKQIELVQANSDGEAAMLRDNRGRTEATLASLVRMSIPVAVLVSALFVGLMTWLNVRERRPEIGLLRALGKRTASIAGLFLGKAVLLGLLGGAVGGAGGFYFAQWIGTTRLEIAAEFFPADWRLLLATVIGAPIVAAMASYLPTLSAVAQDPAIVLADHQ